MRLRCQASILVLAVTLSAPWVAAAEPRPEGRDKTGHPIVSVSEFLSHAWSLITSLRGAAQVCDEGAYIDPLGCPAQPSTDAGAYIDPLG